jgi:hypothetical protein
MTVGPFRLVYVAAAAVLVATAIAHADSPDYQFLALLPKDGIAGPPDQMIIAPLPHRLPHRAGHRSGSCYSTEDDIAGWSVRFGASGFRASPPSNGR